MNTLTISAIILYLVVSLSLIYFRVKMMKALASILILSQVLCVYDIVIREPSQIVWLCNVAVFLNIFLCFKFKQRIFDLYFCFSWIGCFFICLMPTNAYSLMVKDLPVIWLAYWIKHLSPLVMSFYFIRVEGRKLSNWFLYTGVIGFLSYCAVIYFYNHYLGQNILYLNHPEPFMKPLGPFYFIIAVFLGYYWLGLVETIATLANAVRLPLSKESSKEELLELENQSSDGS